MDTKQRADLASQILANPVFTEVFEIVKAAYTQQIIKAAYEDDTTRREFSVCIRCLEDIKQTLTACVETGKVDLIQAERLKKAQNVK